MRSPESPRSKRVHRAIASTMRWLHIYLSMFGLATILFFSVTGLTLNHPSWFFRERTSQREGQLDSTWLKTQAPVPPDWDGNDFGHEVMKLEVAEHLRAEHGLQGTVTDFLAFEDQCEVTFQGPGYTAQARIDRASGHYDLLVTSNDMISVLNDLHKGRHSGQAWSWVIDVSAIVSALVGLTGLVLLFYLKLRRLTGLLTGLAGALVLGLMYWIATA